MIALGLLTLATVWLLICRFIANRIPQLREHPWRRRLAITGLFLLPLIDIPIGIGLAKWWAAELGPNRIFRQVEAPGLVVLGLEIGAPRTAINLMTRELLTGEDPYAYVEIENKGPDLWSLGHGSARARLPAGWYRMRLEHRPIAECEADPLVDAKRYTAFFDAADISTAGRWPEGGCATFEALQRPISRYAYQIDSQPVDVGWIARVFGIDARCREAFVRSSREILGQGCWVTFTQWLPLFNETPSWFTTDDAYFRVQNIVKPIQELSE